MSTISSQVKGGFERAVGSAFDRRESSVMVGLIVIFAIGVFIEPERFLTINNLFRVMRSAAIVTIIGYGMALLMVTAEFDLSVGSLFALSAGLTAILIGEHGLDPIFAVGVVIVFAVIFGISQGLLVTKLNLPSLIVTIGTLTFVRGIHRLILGGQSATIGPDQGGLILEALGGTFELSTLNDLTAGLFPAVVRYQVPFVHEEVQAWSSFSYQIVWIFVLLGLFHYLLFYTRFGYHIRATGDNIESVNTTGIDPEILKLACFGIVAATAAFAGVSQLGRIGSVSPGTGDGTALIVIAAVVLGGTKLTGGEGSMIGVLMGALVLALAQNILTVAGYGVGGWQAIITGLFIIAAIGLDTIFKNVHSDLLSRWYTTPLWQIARSPTDFFREKAIQKTTDDTMAFLMLSIGVTGLLLWVEMTAVQSLGPLIGLEGLSFGFFAAGDWTVGMIQTYLLVMFLTILAFITILVVSSRVGGDADYENTLSVVSFGLAPVVLLTIPMIIAGYSIVAVATPGITALVIALPIVLAISAIMRAGIAELHALPRQRALMPVVATLFVWTVVGLWVAISV